MGARFEPIIVVRWILCLRCGRLQARQGGLGPAGRFWTESRRHAATASSFGNRIRL
jgi:hypothetical protein